MNAMSGSVPAQADLNWQMTGLFLLTLFLLGIVMKLVALLALQARLSRHGLTARQSGNQKQSLPFWLLLSPNTHRRLRPVGELGLILFRPLWLLALLGLSYWIYRWLADALPGLLRSYAALPILLLMGESIVAVVTVFWLPSGQVLAPLHCRPVLARGIADFWGRRWNLWFSDWFRYVLFERLRRRPVLALVLIFALSGVMHEWVINVPLYCLTGRAWFGSMMIYFVLQAAGLLLEHRFLKHHKKLRVGFAWIVILVPAPLVMNEGLLRVLHLWVG